MTTYRVPFENGESEFTEKRSRFISHIWRVETRAYTKGAKDALDAVGISTMSLWTLWDVPCTYPLFERVKLEITACGGVVRDTEYGADIRLRAAFPAGGAELFVPRLTELSAGSLAMEAAGEEFLPGPRESANGT